MHDILELQCRPVSLFVYRRKSYFFTRPLISNFATNANGLQIKRIATPLRHKISVTLT